MKCLTPTKTPRLAFCKHDKSLQSFVGFKSAESCEQGTTLNYNVIGHALHETDVCDAKETHK